MDGCPAGGGRLMGAVRAEKGCRRPSLLVSWAEDVKVMIRPALAVHHCRPSLQGGRRIPSGELTQRQGTHPTSDGKHYMMAESEAFNELWAVEVRAEVQPSDNGTDVSSPLSRFLSHACEAQPGTRREQGIKLLSWSRHANLPTPCKLGNKLRFFRCLPETWICRENVGHLVNC